MFAVLLVPECRLQAALRHRQELRGKPVVLVEKESAKGVVMQRTEAAEKFGVTVGMPVVQALARCPQLAILTRAKAQENSVNAALLETAFSLSPEVEVTADGFCTVDMRGCRVGDWSAWGAEIIRRLAALELTTQIGVDRKSVV